MSDKFDNFIKEKLNSELNNLKVSASLKSNIKLKTINKKKGVFKNICSFLNKTIEINLYTITAIFMIFFIGSYSTFTIALNRNTQDEIKGYKDYKIITVNGINVIVENDNEKVSLIEKH